MTRELSPPKGTVAFLFTDVEGSTRSWSEDSEAMSASLLVHDEILRDGITAQGGYVFTTAGDSFCAAFSRASDAIASAGAIQERLCSATWPGPVLKVRMGLHLGEAEERGGDYFGPAVNTAARVEAAGHGGQILITEAVRLAAAISATDLGIHRLRDVDEPFRLYQVGDGEFPPLRVTDPGSTNLPTAPGGLVGRATDIRVVREALMASRLVTLTAGGGTGKTRLALAVGDLELPDRSDGVWFVDLTPVADGEQVAANVAAGLGLTLFAGDTTEQIAEYLADKDLLLIIDNCEHLVDECAELLAVLISRPGRFTILATSRERLDVEGEVAFQVQPLSTSDETGAVELFRQRAAAVGSGFSLTEENTASVVELCRRLDGVPLAIELAAARSAVMSPQELLAGIQDRFQILHGGRRRQRQRTLEATLDWSYDLLEADEQDLFRSLGVFVGTFDLGAVAALAEVPRATALDLVESLIEKSLIVREEAGGVSRYRLFETTAAYAERRLADAGEGAASRNRHLDYYLATAKRYARAAYADLAAKAELGPDKTNVVAAIEWAGSNGHWNIGGELLLRAFTIFYPHPTEGIDLANRCIDHLEDDDLAMLLVCNNVTLHLVMSDFLGARAGLRRLRESPNPVHQAFGYTLLAILFGPSDNPRACEILSRATELVATIEDDHDAAAAAGLCAQAAGSIANLRLEPTEAREHDARALARSAELGYQSDNFAHSILNSAVSALMLDEPSAAIDAANRYRDLAPVFGTGDEIRALAYIASGDLENALDAARAQARIAVTGRFPQQATDSLLVLAALASAENDRSAAQQFLVGMGQCRTAELTGYARHLAAQLGIRTEFEASQRPILADTGALIRRKASDDVRTLRHEMNRRGWY